MQQGWRHPKKEETDVTCEGGVSRYTEVRSHPRIPPTTRNAASAAETPALPAFVAAHSAAQPHAVSMAPHHDIRPVFF